MSIDKRIVHLCYALEQSLRYKRAKRLFYDLLDNPQSRVRPYFDISMIVLILASVFLLIYGARHRLGPWAEDFDNLVVAVFVVEYLLRMWVHSDSHSIVIEHHERAEFLNTRFRLLPALRAVLRSKWEYMSRPMAVIDLLAILPSYRSLRVLRIFLLFRLFKLFRYARSVNEFTKVLSEKRFEIYTLGGFMGFVIFATSTAIYLFESDLPGTQVQTYFDAVYWSLVTLSTVGYGDITPHSTEGRFVALVLIISGIAVISFSTSIIVSAFTEKLREMQEHRVFAEIEKIRQFTIVCGYGRVGEVVVEKLAEERERFIIIEKDAASVARAKKRGYLAIEGNAERSELLANVGIRDRAQTILCITGDDVTNVFITLTARELNPDIRIISRCNSRRSTAAKLRLAGANHVVAPFEVVGLMAAEYIGKPVAFEAVYGLLSGRNNVSIDTIVVPKGTFIDGKQIGEVSFADYRLILFGIIPGATEVVCTAYACFPLAVQSFVFNPPRDYVVAANDLLVVFGHNLSIVHFRDRLGQSSIATMGA